MLTPEIPYKKTNLLISPFDVERFDFLVYDSFLQTTTVKVILNLPYNDYFSSPYGNFLI